MDTILEIKNDKRDWSEIVFDPATSLEIRKSQIHGRGVFATKNIVAGDVIETFPLVPLRFRLRYIGDPQIICNTLIHSTCPCEDCKEHGYAAYMSAGNGMFYNHQDDHNAELHVEWNLLYCEVRARKNIKPDSEIFINYGKNYPWEIAGISKITLESPE